VSDFVELRQEMFILPAMFRIIRKLRQYSSRFGLFRLLKIIFLILLAKMFGRRVVRLAAGWPVQKITLPGIAHPIHIRPGTTDIEVLQQVLLDNEYEFTLPVVPKIIIDAGANIGLASVYFANVFPHATIVAIEPDASNFKMLQKNLAAYPQVRILHAALWGTDGKLNLFYPNGGHCGFRTLEGSGDGLAGCGQVGAVTIQSLMQSMQLPTIDLLKIDIEGAEREVFQHSAAWIDKTKMMMVELHDAYQPGCSEAFRAAVGKFNPRLSTKGETTLCLLAT
jgi:FkbM family methyltransferase